MDIPLLKKSNRDREFNKYNTYEKAMVLYEYMFNSKSHRELDKSILNINNESVRGFESMNILHYLGIRNEFKGIFKELSIDRAIEILELKDFELYEQIISLLNEVLKQEFLERENIIVKPVINTKEESVPIIIKKQNTSNDRNKNVKNFDYISKNKRDAIIGELGEQRVLESEKKKLNEIGRNDLAESVEWTSKIHGDGLGYDIKSWDIENGLKVRKYIEVKTTTSNKETPFYITRNEIEKSKQLKDNYYIYRVFNFKKDDGILKYYILKGDIAETCELVPETYKVYTKEV